MITNKVRSLVSSVISDDTGEKCGKTYIERGLLFKDVYLNFFEMVCECDRQLVKTLDNRVPATFQELRQACMEIMSYYYNRLIEELGPNE